VRLGTLVIWSTLNGVFLLPSPFEPAGVYRPLVPPRLGVLLNLAVAVGFLWWFVWRPAARRNRRRLATLRVRPAGEAWGWVPVVVAAILGLAPAGLIVTARLLEPPSDRIRALESYARVPGAPLALLVAVALVAPLLEEFLFRGWMQHSLERLFRRGEDGRGHRGAAWRAIAVTSVAFAAVHADAFGFPLRLVLAFAAGYSAWATRSIWPSVVLHGSYNAWAMALGAFLPVRTTRDLTRLAREGEVLWPAALGLLASAALLVWALARMAATAERARAEARGQGEPGTR
jgi:hypothetical protein